MQILRCKFIELVWLRVALIFDWCSHFNNADTPYYIQTDCHLNMDSSDWLECVIFGAIPILIATLCRFWGADWSRWIASVWRCNSSVLPISTTQMLHITPKSIAIRILAHEMEQNTHSTAPSHFRLHISADFEVQIHRVGLHPCGAVIRVFFPFQRHRCSI